MLLYPTQLYLQIRTRIQALQIQLIVGNVEARDIFVGQVCTGPLSQEPVLTVPEQEK
jgi:hypothetical protein